MAADGANGSLRAEVIPRRRARAHLLWLTALVSVACGGEANRGAIPRDSENGGSSSGAVSGVSGGPVAVSGGAVGAGGKAATADDGADVAGAAGALGMCPSYDLDVAGCGFVQRDLRQHPLNPLGACAFVLDPPPASANRNTVNIDCEFQAPVGSTGGWHLEPGKVGACGQFADPAPDKGIVLVLEGDVCEAALRAERVDVFYGCPCLI